jgi:hypothetical protein
LNDGTKSLDNVLSLSCELFSWTEPSLVFSSMSRLNASTPLSTPSGRDVDAVDDEDSGIVLARKGFRRVDGWAMLGMAYCSWDEDEVDVRSGTRANHVSFFVNSHSLPCTKIIDLSIRFSTCQWPTSRIMA